MSDATLATCPRCGSDTIHRVIQLIPVSYHGTGFYTTDNRASSVTNSTRSDSVVRAIDPSQ